MGAYPPQGPGDTESLIDSRITTHEADTSTHGVTGTILGTEDIDVDDGVAGLDSNGLLSPSVMYPFFEEYCNHLGKVDNFTETVINGNGTAIEDAANHEMDLNGGITNTGYSIFKTKKSWTLSSKPIVMNIIVNNISIGADGAKSIYAGLRSNFTSDAYTIDGCGLFIMNDGTVQLFAANGVGWDSDVITVSNGDLLTFVATNSLVQCYKNGTFQAERATHIPNDPLYGGAAVIVWAGGVTVAPTISLDYMSIKRYM